jgi:peptidoglycan/LPS O-acetylase OafA/YrhL/beta-glucanase (GH16 family)
MSKANCVENGEIAAVQYLRAVAALFVLYIHTGVYTQKFFWPSARGFGASGVDLFFVISGFIMLVITTRRPLPPRAFLLRRAIRIVPLYWLVTLGILVVGLFWPAAMLHNVVAFDHVLLSLLFIPHINPLEGSYAPFFKLGWTLNYEVFFYLAFAAFLTIPAMRDRLAALTGAFLAAVALYVAIWPDDPFLHTFCNPIILEFVIGAWVGRLYLEGRLQNIAPRAAAGLFVLGLLGMTVFFDSRDIGRVPTAGLGAAALMIALLSLEARGRLPIRPGLVLLGDASYSIYLVHPLALSAARLVADRLRLPVEQAAPGMLALLAIMALAVAAGVATHVWVERPMLAFLRGRLLAPPRRARSRRGATGPAAVARRIGAPLVLLAIALAGSLLLARSAPAATGAGETPRLLHEEDFSRGTPLDDDFWTYETGFVRNHEEQYYRASNVFVRDGALVLEGRVEEVENTAFDPASSDWRRSKPRADLTSGSIVTRRPLRHGAIEIVARAPSGAGTWPAIWMLGEDGRPYREIDILEAVGQQPDLVFTSAHSGPSLDRVTNWSAKTKVEGLSARSHLYRLEWTAERVAVSIDGRTVLTVDPSGAGEALRRPMNLRINLALGGEWGGEIDRSALPTRFEIESIRIFANGS